MPVLCDTVLMTEGSGLYLAGPAAWSRRPSARIFRMRNSAARGCMRRSAEPSTTTSSDDESCLARLRRLIALLPPDPKKAGEDLPVPPPARPADDLFTIVRTDSSSQYDVRDVLTALVDGGQYDEYRADYGKSLFCGFARLGEFRSGSWPTNG